MGTAMFYAMIDVCRASDNYYMKWLDFEKHYR